MMYKAKLSLEKPDNIFSIKKTLSPYFRFTSRYSRRAFLASLPTAPTRSVRDMWVLYIVFMFYNDLLGVAKMSQYQLCCDIENL